MWFVVDEINFYINQIDEIILCAISRNDFCLVYGITIALIWVMTLKLNRQNIFTLVHACNASSVLKVSYDLLQEICLFGWIIKLNYMILIQRCIYHFLCMLSNYIKSLFWKISVHYFSVLPFRFICRKNISNNKIRYKR